jgi:radical SAM protein with 4Fe4S-binding SPASM domain
MKTEGEKDCSFEILKLSGPAYAYLETTYDCAGKCPGCPALAADQRLAAMPAVQWSPIIKGLSKHVEEVRLTGGEPTLHPEFIDLIGLLKSAELPFKIYTNGLWPDPKGLLRVLKKNDYFRGFNFSLHGSTPSIHETFTGISDFEGITACIRKTVKEGFHVSTSTVLGAFNRGNIPGIMKLAAMLGSRRHYFRRYLGPYQAMISLEREHISATLEMIDMIPPEIFSFSVGECFPRCFYRRALPCLAGITHITVTPTGHVKACPFSTELLGSWKIGRMSGKKRIHGWASDYHRDCLRCDGIQACMGGCRALRRNFHFKRDPLMEESLEPDPAPPHASAGKPIILSGYLRLRSMIRREAFGHVLIREGEVLPVTERALEALTLCDGTRTIGEIGDGAGEETKAFILSLYLRGFIELV